MEFNQFESKTCLQGAHPKNVWTPSLQPNGCDLYINAKGLLKKKLLPSLAQQMNNMCDFAKN